MLANWLMLDYEPYGYVDEKGSLFIPISMIDEFMNDCNQYRIAMAAVDFILPSEDEMYYQVHNLDCSEIVWGLTNWDQLVDYCNQVIIQEVKEESKAEYFVPYLLEEYEWRMKRINEDAIPSWSEFEEELVGEEV